MKERILYWAYDMAETANYRYGKFAEYWSPGAGTLSTSGSSTTVTANTSGAFADVKVGDLIKVLSDAYASNGPTYSTVKIVTKNSTSEIVVSSALTLTAAAPWSYLIAEVPATGTSAGWFHVGADANGTVHPTVTTVAAAGGIDLIVEAKGRSGFISILHSVNYASATVEEPIPIGEDIEFLRVGLKGGSGFAGTDVIDVVYTATPRT